MVGDGREGRKTVLAPSPHAHLAPLLIASGMVFSLVGWVDIGLFHVPLRVREPEWQFGVIAQSLDAMALPTLGLVLLSIGVRLRGGSLFWSRVLGTVLGAVAILCLGALTVFSLNIQPALLAATASGDAMLLSGLRLGIGKALLFGASYSLAYAWMAVFMWQGKGEMS